MEKRRKSARSQVKISEKKEIIIKNTVYIDSISANILHCCKSLNQGYIFLKISETIPYLDLKISKLFRRDLVIEFPSLMVGA